MPPLRPRQLASRICFYAGCLLMVGAGGLLLSAYVLPVEGLQDLGRIVGAMLLAAIAAVPFLIAVAVGRREMPRWMAATSLVGAALGIIPAIAILSARL